MSRAPAIIDHAAPLLAAYDVLFCDVWGVLHDGNRAFAASNAALTAFRDRGGTVVLVSNAPIPAAAVQRLLDQKGVVRGAYDAIVSSGDIATAHIAERGYSRVHRIGPRPRDNAFFDTLAAPDSGTDVADAIACTGLEDDRRERPDDYRARLLPAAERRVPFVCANPDLAVHVGDDLLPCAGALAVFYETLGGPVVWTGKPHASAYATAFETARSIRGAAVARDRVLAIGDAVRTDLAAAHGAGVDALFIASGLHRDDVMRNGAIDKAAVEDLLQAAGVPARAVMTYFAP